MNVLDKVRKYKASRPQGGGRERTRGIFHAWKEGDNVIRLLGEFLEVRTHFVAPVPKRGERGLCMATAFQGDHKIPQVVNCLDWDATTESEKKERKCPICKLHAIAALALKEGPTEEEKKFFEKLRSDTAPRSNLKWNIIDRDDPYVLQIDGDKETKVVGLKIATIGMEAWGDIEGIFEQCGFDITDPENGVDLKVVRGSNGKRTTYSAQAVIKGKELKVTPLSAIEKALKMHDLKVICGKQVEPQRIVDSFHDDLRQILEANIVDDETVAAVVGESAGEALADEDEGDGDGLMDGGPKKGKA